jgi:predicted nucleic acid-binding protein
MLVVDANVVVDLCVSEAGFDVLADHELVAPPLLRAEALSVLHVLHWRRVASSRVIESALERLDDAPVKFAAPRGLAREAWRVAEEFGWKKTYDAEYVALARLLGCRLLTLDERLRRGAARLGFVIPPSEL